VLGVGSDPAQIDWYSWLPCELVDGGLACAEPFTYAQPSTVPARGAYEAEPVLLYIEPEPVSCQ
jgi:hypothetical protein